MNPELIAAIENAGKTLTDRQWRQLRRELRRLAGLPEDTVTLCHCGKIAICKEMCAKHYNLELDAIARPCKCGKPRRIKGLCKACYQRSRYRTAPQPPCTQPRHSWTIQGICKVCRIERKQHKVRIEAHK